MYSIITNHIVPVMSMPLEPWATPMIHHGRLLPARKYDSALRDAFFDTHQPTRAISSKYTSDDCEVDRVHGTSARDK